MGLGLVIIDRALVVVDDPGGVSLLTAGEGPVVCCCGGGGTEPCPGTNCGGVHTPCVCVPPCSSCAGRFYSALLNNGQAIVRFDTPTACCVGPNYRCHYRLSYRHLVRNPGNPACEFLTEATVEGSARFENGATIQEGTVARYRVTVTPETGCGQSFLIEWASPFIVPSCIVSQIQFGAGPGPFFPQTPNCAPFATPPNDTGFERQDCDTYEYMNLSSVAENGGTCDSFLHIRKSIERNVLPQCNPGCTQGACCCAGSCYSNETQAECAQRGGQWMGAGTSCAVVECSPPGNCCLRRNGVSLCVPLERCLCEQIGGNFIGTAPCEQCDPPGACCIDGECHTRTQSNCVIAGGVWYGGLPCEQRPRPPCLATNEPAPRWACCAGGECANMTAAQCQATGGTWFEGQTCGQGGFQCPQLLGSCCVPAVCPVNPGLNDAINETTQAQCLILGGNWTPGVVANCCTYVPPGLQQPSKGCATCGLDKGTGGLLI